jgi:hypothetical protein
MDAYTSAVVIGAEENHFCLLKVKIDMEVSSLRTLSELRWENIGIKKS